MRKNLFLLFVLGCLLFVPCSASAQYRNTGNYVTIRLTPDRADWQPLIARLQQAEAEVCSVRPVRV